MKCEITYFDDTEGELVPVGACEVVVVVTEKEEVGVVLGDGPADELRARSTGCALTAESWLQRFICRTIPKGEAKERATKDRIMSGKCTSIVAGDTRSQTSVRK